jgi:hypothetical protein
MRLKTLIRRLRVTRSRLSWHWTRTTRQAVPRDIAELQAKIAVAVRLRKRRDHLMAELKNMRHAKMRGAQ